MSFLEEKKLLELAYTNFKLELRILNKLDLSDPVNDLEAAKSEALILWCKKYEEINNISR